MDVDSDEEVMLPSSALHKYLADSHMSDLTNKECALSATENTKCDNKRLADTRSSASHCNKQEIIIYGHTANMINEILETGLLYPDHLMDLSEFIKIGDIKTNKLISKANLLSCCSVILTTTGTVALSSLSLKTLTAVQLGLIVTSTYFIYKAYKFIKSYSQERILKDFARSINYLFSLTKKVQLFIVESEIILRGKINKQEPFYLLKQGWVDQNTSEALLSSNLVFPELRKILCGVLQYVTRTFKHLCGYSLSMIQPLPIVDCDNYCKELLESVSEECDQEVNLTVEEIKRLYNRYLLMQSECLKRLIFSFVEELSTNFSSSKYDNLIKEIRKCTRSFTLQAQNLESSYDKFTKVADFNTRQLERNNQLKANDINDRLYLYIKNIVVKTNVKFMSLLFDLRMIDEWICESEENNQRNDGDCTELLKTFYERMFTMKTSIESLNSIFNDHCNVINTMIQNQLSVTATDAKDPVVESIECVKKTGIEIGKSNFDVCGQDEVFVSLTSVGETNEVTLSGDYKEMSEKCLPKKVLLELKSAIKEKRVEMLEREKKVLTSDISLDEFDKLFNSSDEVSVISSASKSCISYGSSELSESDNDSMISVLAKGNSTKVNLDITKNYSSVESPENFVNISNNGNPSSSGQGVYHSTLNSEQGNSHNTLSTYKSFLEQIKSTQRCFNISAQAEEFIDSGSETE